MEAVTFQTVSNFFEKNTRFLIALPKNTTNDTVAAALCLEAVLVAQAKQVTVASAGFLPSKLSFLPNSNKLGSLENSAGRLVVELDVRKSELAELSYETTPEKVRVFLRSKEGSFSVSDVTISADEPVFDAIILLGVESPERLGVLFSDHAELFYSTPRLNIDISPRNDGHGTHNYIDVTRSSVSELVYQLLVSLKYPISPISLTALLAGVLARTNSLKNQRTTPRSFAAVTDLVAAGADYDLVVRELFKTERLSFLKLWGRSLARVKMLEGGLLAYSILSPADMEKTGESAAVADDLLAGLFEHMPNSGGLIVLVPDGEQSRLVARAVPFLDANRFTGELGASGLSFYALDSGLEVFSAQVPIPADSVESLLVEAAGNSLQKM
jgi:nanoRNase/pAp phosphatase (c-di-AMP/oligoRNAs hydrolase)